VNGSRQLSAGILFNQYVFNKEGEVDKQQLPVFFTADRRYMTRIE